MLDPRSLIIASTVMAVCLLAILSTVSAVRWVPKGFGAWTASQGAIAAGSALVAARGAVPAWASIVAGNALILAGMGLIAEGFVRFHGLRRRIPIWLDAAVVLVAAALLAAWLRGSVNLRIVVFGTASAFFLGRAGLEPLASADGRRSTAQRVITGIFLAALALTLVRVGWAAWSPRFDDLWREGWTATVPGLVLMFVNAASMYLALFLCFERSERQLRSALSDVKTLSGLLPICMHCHKIRDDRGYWDKLERFITEHSRARFTHCICPACYKELYPAGPEGPDKQHSTH